MAIGSVKSKDTDSTVVETQQPTSQTSYGSFKNYFAKGAFILQSVLLLLHILFSQYIIQQLEIHIMFGNLA